MMNRKTAGTALFPAILAAVMVASCALTAPSQEPPASYDLGPLPSHEPASPALPVTVLLPDIVAPSWLDSQGIAYRLAYDEPARVRSYAHSRWKAPPAALLSQRMRARFAAATERGVVTGADGARASYMIRVDLEDFCQTFSAPNASQVTVRARASVVNIRQRKLIAQRVFSVDRTAPSADARGAVTAFAEAGNVLVEELLQWTSGQVRAERHKKR
jgi:cholesterol transport system auxiliary component